MFRKYMQDLINWKDRSNRKPLVIRGARQVGKTYIVREFAKIYFEYFIEINFEETPGSKDLFLHDDVGMILQYISLEKDLPIIPGKTLIFLDEIQKAPEVFAKLRYFYEKKSEIHIIAAGSLLDFVLAEHSFSMPVGRIEYMFMNPMDFKEFLLAEGAKSFHDFISEYQLNDGIPESIHNKMQDYLRIYMGVGGMPAAVREYTQSKSLRQCEIELNTILNTFRDDFSKYGKKVDTQRLQLILDKAPNLIGRKIKYTEISRDLKSSDLKASLILLERARIMFRIHHCSGNAVPLRAEKKERDFKLLFLDIGLVMRSLGLNIFDIQNNNLIIANKGSLAEQFIGQQWLSQFESHELPELYYWNREKTGTSAEIDYLFQVNGNIIPIEVKAGTTGSLKSLHVFAAEKKSAVALRYNLGKPVLSDVTSRIPGKEQFTFKLLSLPLYMISETKRLIKVII